MKHAPMANIYGKVPPELASVPVAARQFSPLMPGAEDLTVCAAGSLDNLTMLAPPGTVERRYALACALRALAIDAPLTVMAPNDKGGTRLKQELRNFGCAVDEDSRRHFRLCHTRRPAQTANLDEALANGAPQRVETLGLWSQPGVFSWNRLDPGSALLLRHLPALAGDGADFGCGIGVLARAVLASPQVRSLALIDIDRRAVSCAERNSVDPRATFLWTDIVADCPKLGPLDFVVMNPPFHDGGEEDRSLGQAFIERAHGVLRPGGVCWLTANRHLPYENTLTARFAAVTLKAEVDGYKIYEAIR